MGSYTAIESALISRFVEKFPSELTTDLIKAGDPDAVMEAIFLHNKQYGVVLEFGGGREDREKPFSHPTWVWTIYGVFFVRYDETIEVRLRDIVDKLKRIFDEDSRLAGTTPLARFTSIGESEPGLVNDVPFYWLPFTIEVVDR